MTAPIRVLAFLEAKTITGPAKNLLGFAARARTQGWAEISIATFIRGADCENELTRAIRELGINVHSIPEAAPFDPRIPGRLRSLVERESPDIIQSHSYKSHFLIASQNLQKSHPWVAFHHGYTHTDRKDVVLSRLDRFSLRRANTVVTVCQPFAQRLRSYGVREEHVFVLHNSVAAFTPASSVQTLAVRQAMGISDDRRILLTVGRLSQEKGHRDLLNALGQMSARQRRSLFLIIVGDGPELPNLRRHVADLGIDAHVHFAGHQRELRSYFSLADLFVLPSHSEGSPNVLLEAMAAALPIVTTPVGGVPEILSDSCALMVPPRSPGEMAVAIGRVMADEPLRSGMRAAAVERAREFAPEIYDRRLMEIYRQTLAAAKRL